MGLGLLLLGYLLCINLLNVYFMVPSTVLMYLGLKKMAYIHPAFETARYVLFPLFVLGLLGTSLPIAGLLGWDIPSADLVGTIIYNLVNLLMPFYLYWLFCGIRHLTDEVGLPKLTVRAWRNQWFSLFYYVPALLLGLPFWEDSVFIRLSTLFALAVGFVIFYMNAHLLHDCFRSIEIPEN